MAITSLNNIGIPTTNAAGSTQVLLMPKLKYRLELHCWDLELPQLPNLPSRCRMLQDQKYRLKKRHWMSTIPR